MRNGSFPFPDKDLALRELEADPASGLLSAEEKAELAEKAWEYGCSTARSLLDGTEAGSIRNLLVDRNVQVLTKEQDYVYGGRRYFSIYETGRNRITLYAGSLRLWAKENEISYSEATDMILCHEFFHYLEANEIGYASKLVSLPILKIGRFSFGTKGIRALSEIGAHAFARTFFEITHPEMV